MPTTQTFPTYDYQAEQERLQRKRLMVEAMLSNSLSPAELPQNSGSITSAMNPLQGLAKVFQAYMANKRLQGIEGEERENSQRNKQDLLATMQRYMEVSKTDPRGAIMEAMASNHPVLQQIALQELQNADKGALTPKDLAAMATPESVLSSGGDTSKFVAKKDLKAATPGVPYIDEAGNLAEPGNPTGTAPYNIVEQNGDLYMQTATGLKKLDNAPKTTVSVNANPIIKGQKAGMEAYWKGAAEQVNLMGKAASQAIENKQTLAEMKNLDQNGIFSNVTTGPTTFLTNLGQAIGVEVKPEVLANTESYKALTTDLWQGLVSRYGGNRGVTKEEAAEIKLILPQAAQSPQARKQLFEILDRAADRQIQRYQNANMSFATAVKFDDPEMFAEQFKDVFMADPTEPEPVTQVPAQPNVMSFDEYLESRENR